MVESVALQFDLSIISYTYFLFFHQAILINNVSQPDFIGCNHPVLSLKIVARMYLTSRY